MLEGMPGVERALRSKEPMVFINACQVGQPTPALSQYRRIASAFHRTRRAMRDRPDLERQGFGRRTGSAQLLWRSEAPPQRPFAGILATFASVHMRDRVRRTAGRPTASTATRSPRQH